MLHSWDFAKKMRDIEAKKYGKVYYRRDNNANNYGWQYNVGQWYNDHFCFDCIGIIKAVCNDWKADKKATAGGTTLDEFIDLTEEGLLKKCTSVSNNFKNIVVGEYLYMNGHGAVYTGTFKAGNYYYNTVEVTLDNVVGNGCCKSWVDLNTGKRYNHQYGTQSGAWLKHGRLSTKIDYSKKETATTTTNIINENQTIKSLCTNIAVDILNGSYGNNPERKKKIIEKYGNAIYTLAQKYVDNSF